MEKKLKVLLIAYNNLGKGGIQNQLIGIIRTLKDKVNFDIVIWDNKRNYYREELESYDNVRIIECFRHIEKYNKLRQKADAFIRYNDLKQRISNIIKEYGPYDVIHCNNAFDAAPCLHAAYENHIPVRISHAHNTENPSLSKKLVYPAYKKLYNHQRKRIRKYATHMIGCSKQVCDYFFGQDLGEVVHIGIDLSKFYDIEPNRGNSEIKELLHVGNMSEQKNQLFTVDIIDELRNIRKDFHMTLIGGGTTYLDQVKEKIEEKNLTQFITILPPESNVPEAMSKSDLFVFPSSFEGFGIVLIEAQSLGLKCICSEVVTEEANCGGMITVPLMDGPQGWAKAIDQQLNLKNQTADRYDVSEFSVENMGNNIFKKYIGE